MKNNMHSHTISAEEDTSSFCKMISKLSIIHSQKILDRGKVTQYYSCTQKLLEFSLYLTFFARNSYRSTVLSKKNIVFYFTSNFYQNHRK